MILLITALAIVVVGVGAGCYYSKRRFENEVAETCTITDSPIIDSFGLEQEFDRMEELKANLREVRENVEDLDIPAPEALSSNDDMQSSLNKLSRFFEEHSLETVGTEQLILSLLPTSQIGNSLHAMAEALPLNLGQAVFGDALTSIKDSVSSIPQDGLARFLSGFTHLGTLQRESMYYHFELHQPLSALMTPVKSGIFEATGIHDATRNVAESLNSIGSDMTAAVESSPSLTDLTNTTDFDITGHIPVITMAISSFREFKLLSEDKTDFISSIKNIALDATGAGIGAAVGAKAGALAGCIFGPIGTLVGSIVGGVGGAVAGRYATNKVKMLPLDNAIEAYQTAYGNMKSETESESKNTLTSIHDFAETRRSEFKDSEIVNSIPVVDTDSTVSQIAVIIYQFIVNEIVEMKAGVAKLRESIWYSESRHSVIVSDYEKQIETIERQLPSTEQIKDSPEIVIDALINLEMPNRKISADFQAKVEECRKEIKAINDKNDSSILIWSYMVNNLYQKTLNDIAEYSNKKISTLNTFFDTWKKRMENLEDDIKCERDKLGI